MKKVVGLRNTWAEAEHCTKEEFREAARLNLRQVPDFWVRSRRSYTYTMSYQTLPRFFLLRT
ncbi:hypothetical protein [Allocoleopsis sp.]|uniref:hypothetical protein n=1 Tax=Allocoleopsis sp. TaxID=3088169 RepID=UPI002FD3293E